MAVLRFENAGWCYGVVLGAVATGHNLTLTSGVALNAYFVVVEIGVEQTDVEVLSTVVAALQYAPFPLLTKSAAVPILFSKIAAKRVFVWI